MSFPFSAPHFSFLSIYLSSFSIFSFPSFLFFSSFLPSFFSPHFRSFRLVLWASKLHLRVLLIMCQSRRYFYAWTEVAFVLRRKKPNSSPGGWAIDHEDSLLHIPTLSLFPFHPHPRHRDSHLEIRACRKAARRSSLGDICILRRCICLEVLIGWEEWVGE